MRSRIRLTSLVCVLILAGTASGDDLGAKPGGNVAAPTSVQAIDAKKKFDEVMQAAQKAGDDAAAAAKAHYMADLERVLASSMSAANIADANWAKAELARAKEGDFDPRDVPKLKVPAETRARYDRAVDKAYVDQRPHVEAARKQYVAELEACKKLALSQGKDLDEANRIAAEIPRANTRDVLSKEWVNMLAPSHQSDWEQGKDLGAKKFTLQPDGSILLGGFCFYGRDFANGRIHARVRKISGLNLVLILRSSAAGSYMAFCNGGTSFGIGMHKDGHWSDLAGAKSKPYEGLADMEFSAVGQELVLTVGGQELIRVKDASYERGRAGIGANTQAQMADIRLRILDGSAVPPAAGKP